MLGLRSRAVACSLLTVILGAWLGAHGAVTGAADSGKVGRYEAPGQPGRPCASAKCEIALVKVTSLSEKGHPGTIPGPSPYVVQDREGRFYLATARGQVAVFDNAGRIASVVGKPGEFGRVASVFSGPRGSVLAYNFIGRELREIGPAKRQRAESVQPVRVDYPPALVRDDGTIVVTQQIRTSELMGYPLHLLAGDGRVIRSFGADVPEYRADLRLLMDRVVAPGSGGSMWAAPRGRYILERWNLTNGSLITRLAVSSSWFIESAAYPRDGQTRPTPVIQALWERDDQIWVLIRDADAVWKPSAENTERPWELKLVNGMYDWVLEVVDGRNGTVLATKRFDGALYGRAPQPYVVSHATVRSNEPNALDVWKPELRRKENDKW